jgi:hypothetical protein
MCGTTSFSDPSLLLVLTRLILTLFPLLFLISLLIVVSLIIL